MDHKKEDLLSTEWFSLQCDFFFNLFYTDDLGNQKAGGNSCDGHHHRIGQKIKEIQKLHADDGYVCQWSVSQAGQRIQGIP